MRCCELASAWIGRKDIHCGGAAGWDFEGSVNVMMMALLKLTFKIYSVIMYLSCGVDDNAGAGNPRCYRKIQSF